jgi:hypothetical protein
MSTTALKLNMAVRPLPSASRLGLFVVFLLCGLAVFVLGCNYYHIFPTNGSLVYEGVLTAVLLFVAVAIKKNGRFPRYWPIAYAFFMASAVWFITSLLGGLGNLALRLTGVSDATPMGTAVGKLGEVAGTVAILLILNRLAGWDLASVYLKRGNLKWALIVGSLVVVNFGTAALMASTGQVGSPELLGQLLTWGLVFSLANGFMEELWFRGIFLGKLEPLIGRIGAVVLTALLFSAMHAGALYMSPAALWVFLINLVTHGLAMGYLVFKMDNLWGASLYHAGCDLWLFIIMAGVL